MLGEEVTGEPPKVGDLLPRAGDRFSGVNTPLVLAGSTGVGGVFTMTGAWPSPSGGVRGVSVEILTVGTVGPRDERYAGFGEVGSSASRGGLRIAS